MQVRTPDFALLERARDAAAYSARMDRSEVIEAAKARLSDQILDLIRSGNWTAVPEYSAPVRGRLLSLGELFSDEINGDFDAFLPLIPALLSGADVSAAATPLIRGIATRIADYLIDRADDDGRI